MNAPACRHDVDIHSSATSSPLRFGADLLDEVSPSQVGSLSELYAHALMAGTQATAACDELSEILESRGERATAALLLLLAESEATRMSEIVRRADSLPLPQLSSWQYNWLYNAPPHDAVREVVARLMTPHAALRIALDAERRVLTMYESLSVAAGNAAVRAYARELGAEKAQQVKWIGDALATVPAPFA